MRKVCVVVGSRANYGSIKSVMRAVKAHPDLHLQLIVAASALLDRFGSVVDMIERDGFMPDARVNMIVEGETPVTMAKSTGPRAAGAPDTVRVAQTGRRRHRGRSLRDHGHRRGGRLHEHPAGPHHGRRSDGHDRREHPARHHEAGARPLSRRTRTPPTASSGSARIRTAVHVVGCPRIDLVAEVISNGSAALDADWLDREGVGGHIATDEPFLLVSQHPVTTEYGQAEDQITETLMALHELKMPTVMLWPNVDAGSEDVSRGMRKFRERYKPDYIRFYKNFPVETFLRLMRSAACLVGNSSASIREGAFIGTPAVNIGSRQDGRERGPNVVDVGYDRAAIAAAIRRRSRTGRITPAHLYGDGKPARASPTCWRARRCTSRSGSRY